MREIFDPKDVMAIVQNEDRLDKAKIAFKIAQRPNTVQVIDINLATAQLETQPYPINFPFKSIYIQDATDIYGEVSVKLGSRDTVQSAFKMRKNDSLSQDFSTPNAFLHWTAQPGKTMRIVLFTDAKFESGSQISVSGGGVSINDGSTIDLREVTLVATTAAIIAPADSLRKVTTIENTTGADLYVGDATVTNATPTRGIKIAPGSFLYWRNTGALYGYSVAGGIVTMSDEV